MAGACGVSAGLTGERGRENGMTIWFCRDCAMGEWYIVKSKPSGTKPAAFFLFSKPNIFHLFARHLQLFCGLFQLKSYLTNLAATPKKFSFCKASIE